MVTEPGYRDFDGRLIRLRGVLRRVLPVDRGGNVTLIIESDERLVRAFLPVSAGVPLPEVDRWVADSVVELTGACELEIARITPMSAQVERTPSAAAQAPSGD